jgi:multidrug efflux pump subunit AcrB
LKKHLHSFPGASEITDSFRGGKKEVQLRIKPSAENLGLSQRELASQVRQGFYGEEVQRIQKKGEDMRVMVRYPKEQRQSLAALEDMRIRTSGGDEVPFHSVAEATFTHGFAAIERTSRARTVNVTAKIDSLKSKLSANEIIALLEKGEDGEPGFVPKLMTKYPSLSNFSFEGDQRDQMETQESLRSGYFIVIFLIYALLAIPLKSYAQPLLVMSAIPFGFVGAILGHWLLGLELSIMSMFGFVALTGVVVNDNLVLIDFINRKRREGTPLMEAVAESGAARFRPILLTSLTTCASLTPLLLERSVQAMFLVPMGVSLAFGVLFATTVSLVLVPSGYLIMEDILGLFRRKTTVAVP